MDPDGGCPYMFTPGSHMSHDLGFHLLSRLGSVVDNSIYHVNHLYVPGNIALQEAFSCISKFAGALFLWLSTGSNSNPHHKSRGGSNGSKLGRILSSTQVKHVISCRQNLTRLKFGSSSKSESFNPALFAKVAASTVRRLWMEVGQLHPNHILSLAAAIVPSLDNLSSKVLAIPVENSNGQINRYADQAGCEDGYRGCPSLPLSNISLTRDIVEPKTGIKFPAYLDNCLAEEDKFHHITEVLVGTGSRSMRIVKVKSLKLYAFGFYVHPDSICEKLGPKYASVPLNELKERTDFLEDLLREDIHMTVRMVVNCSGIKISAVKDAFEKSLRARLQKMNPGTDYHCLSAFGSYFTRDIPLPVGTTIDFRKTVDWQLITEIGGKHIGAVHSKDLCRAFFDMYIGEVPTSMQAKQEIAQNVAGLVRRC